MKKDIYAVVAANVRASRGRTGISIEKLAEIAGIGAGFLAHIETDQKKPSVATLGKIADALQIGVGDLFKGRPAQPVDPDYRLALELTAILRKKSAPQKRAMVKAFRTLVKTL